VWLCVQKQKGPELIPIIILISNVSNVNTIIILIITLMAGSAASILHARLWPV